MPYLLPSKVIEVNVWFFATYNVLRVYKTLLLRVPLAGTSPVALVHLGFSTELTVSLRPFKVETLNV